jgi:pyruvate,orthophosphate dikinase
MAKKTAAKRAGKSPIPNPQSPRGRKHVYFFGNGKADGNRNMKDLLGGKGSGLAEMTNAGLPVPPGFTISTEVCNIYYEQNKKIPARLE